MAYEEFVLRIRLGNDAMKHPEDIAVAVAEVAENLAHMPAGRDAKPIRDGNGNAVGEYALHKVGGGTALDVETEFDKMLRLVDPMEAREALVAAAAYVGGLAEWDSGTIEGVVQGMNDALPHDCDDAEATENWGPVSLELGYETDWQPEDDDDEEDAR